MQLSPLQSRLVASLAATICLAALYLLLSSPRGALAAELPLDSSPWIDPSALDTDNGESQTLSYEPVFNLFSRSILGRAQDVTPLENNKPLGLNLNPGSSPICYIIKRGSLNVSKGNQRRQDESENGGGDENNKNSTTIFISANTCLQPIIIGNKKTTTPPQLTLFVSNKTDAACPQITSTPNGAEAKGFTSKVFDEGAVTLSINSTNDVYVAIYAPKISDQFQGTYNFEVAASNTTYFHQYEATGSAELLWMDSDSTSALLMTRNLTDEASDVGHVMGEDPPYQLYVSGSDAENLTGLRHSACGLQKNAPIGANNQGNAKNNIMIKTAMTLRGPGNLPKQQFYVVGLNATSDYNGVLVKPANLTVNAKRQEGGGLGVALTSPGSIVYQATKFETNAGEFVSLLLRRMMPRGAVTNDVAAPNCKVVTDLEFCNEIQYAVPGNDGKFNNTELAKAYDNYAKSMYDNFLKVMMQIQCETDSTSRYSLARNCDDCKNAYKRWLCTVSIPRCEDFQGDSLFTVIRNVGQPFPNGSTLATDLQTSLAQVPSQNISRNSFIDTTIQPGPYKEILPCEDICFQVVQSCPAAIGFKCPQEGMYGFNVSYGKRNGDRSLVSCNFPGEARTPTGGVAAAVPNLILLAGILSLSSLLVLG
jgi:calcium channel MID1